MKRHSLPITPIYQGQTNGCGTACLAMVLNYFHKLDNTSASELTQAELDWECRKRDSFTSPQLLRQAAHQRGIHARFYNHATWDEIQAHLDNNRPLIALHQVGQTLADFHYVVIHGYEIADDASTPVLFMVDPAIRPEHQPVRTSYSEFCRNHWNNLRLRGIPIGLNCACLAFSSHDDLSQESPWPWSLKLANVAAKVLNL
jgi:ABC-type bacteriocin/lantibiotic exporter with double-glycine peptidase domain